MRKRERERRRKSLTRPRPLKRPRHEKDEIRQALQELQEIERTFGSHDVLPWTQLQEAHTPFLLHYLFSFGLSRSRLRPLSREELICVAHVVNAEQLLEDEEKRSIRISKTLKPLINLCNRYLIAIVEEETDDDDSDGEDYEEEVEPDREELFAVTIALAEFAAVRAYEKKLKQREHKRAEEEIGRSQQAADTDRDERRISSLLSRFQGDSTYSIKEGDMRDLPCVNFAQDELTWQGDLLLLKLLTDRQLRLLYEERAKMATKLKPSVEFPSTLDEPVKRMLASSRPNYPELTELFVEHFRYLAAQDTIPARAQFVFKDTTKRQLLRNLRALLVQDGSESTAAPFISMLLTVMDVMDLFDYTRTQLRVPQPPDRCFRSGFASRATTAVAADGMFGFLLPETIPTHLQSSVPSVSEICFPFAVIEEAGYESFEDHPKLAYEMTGFLYHHKNWAIANEIDQDEFLNLPVLGLRVFNKHLVRAYIAFLTPIEPAVSSSSPPLATFFSLTEYWDLRNPSAAASLVILVSNFLDTYAPLWLRLIKKYTTKPEGYGGSFLENTTENSGSGGNQTDEAGREDRETSEINENKEKRHHEDGGSYTDGGAAHGGGRKRSLLPGADHGSDGERESFTTGVLWDAQKPLKKYNHSRGELPKLHVLIVLGEDLKRGRLLVAKSLQPCIMKLEGKDLYRYERSAVACMKNELRISKIAQGHPNIIPLLGTRKKAYVNYTHSAYVMFFPYIAHVIPAELTELRMYIQQLFLALQHLHALGIVHCDVKKSNYLWDANEKRGYLIDFGLAHDKDTPLPLKYAHKGTVGYTPPNEVYNVGPARDMYASGIMLNELSLLRRCLRKDALFLDLTEKLTEVPAERRLTPIEALQHPFLFSETMISTTTKSFRLSSAGSIG